MVTGSRTTTACEGPGDRAKRASHRHVRRAGGDQYRYIPPAGLHAGREIFR